MLFPSFFLWLFPPLYSLPFFLFPPILWLSGKNMQTWEPKIEDFFFFFFFPKSFSSPLQPARPLSLSHPFSHPPPVFSVVSSVGKKEWLWIIQRKTVFGERELAGSILTAFGFRETLNFKQKKFFNGQLFVFIVVSFIICSFFSC